MGRRHLVLALVTASQAAAAAPATSLTWDAPGTCPAAGEVRDRIEARLHLPLESLDHRIGVVVASDAQGFVARIELDSGDDHEVRTLGATKCDELVDAIALIVSRLAHVRAEPAVAILPPHPFVFSDVDLEIPPPLPRVVAAAPVPLTWTIGARVAALGGVGLLPSASAGAEVTAYIARGPARFELGYESWASSRGRSMFEGLDGVDIALTAMNARVAWRVGTLPLHVRTGYEVGVMRGSAYGAFAGRIDPATWMAVGAGLEAAWRARPWLRLVATGDTCVALQRPRFLLSDGRMFYEPGELSARLSVGLEVGLP